MKLESLNNPKYSLTPEKMGQLVGGEQNQTWSDGGYIYHGFAISADYTWVDDEGNQCQQHYYGKGDVALRDADHPKANEVLRP